MLEGTVDASFRAVPADQVPAGISAERIADAPLQLLVGPAHPLANAPAIRPGLQGSDPAQNGRRSMTRWPRSSD
ncbi:hypothetical protein ACH4D3_13600 [Streptomyces sp. NPDC018026]|uniref:hypothetical protein n=1 Tax=Streptomyces sp. NPDC018026 TaxID=3365031 RepID=UPI00379681F6